MARDANKPPKARKCPGCNADVADTDELCPVKTCGFNIKRFDELVENEDTPMFVALIKRVFSEEGNKKPPEKEPSEKKGWFGI